MQENGFEALITGDKNIQHQHYYWQRYPLPVIVLAVRPMIYAELVKLVPQVLAQPGLAGGVPVVNF